MVKFKTICLNLTFFLPILLFNRSLKIINNYQQIEMKHLFVINFPATLPSPEPDRYIGCSILAYHSYICIWVYVVRNALLFLHNTKQIVFVVGWQHFLYIKSKSLLSLWPDVNLDNKVHYLTIKYPASIYISLSQLLNNHIWEITGILITPWYLYWPWPQQSSIGRALYRSLINFNFNRSLKCSTLKK